MKKILLRTPIAPIRSALVAMLLVICPLHAAKAGPGSDGSADARQAAWSSPLIFFQRVISRADGDRCPMAPSCSHYAATVFKKHHPVTAWVLTCDRLLRCGHDEVRQSSREWAGGRRRTVDPVSANTFWWRKP